MLSVHFSNERIFLTLTGIVVLIAAWIILRKFEKNIVVKLRGENDIFTPFVGKLLKLLILLIGLLAFAEMLGLNVSSVIHLIGLLFVGAGFVFKDMLADLMAGIFILTCHPFKQGETLTIQHPQYNYTFTGKIRAVDIRYTTIDDSGARVLIPNSLLFKVPVRISKT